MSKRPQTGIFHCCQSTMLALLKNDLISDAKEQMIAHHDVTAMAAAA